MWAAREEQPQLPLPCFPCPCGRAGGQRRVNATALRGLRHHSRKLRRSEKLQCRPGSGMRLLGPGHRVHPMPRVQPMSTPCTTDLPRVCKCGTGRRKIVHPHLPLGPGLIWGGNRLGMWVG